MRFDERKFTLKDGRTCTLGGTTPDYAEDIRTP